MSLSESWVPVEEAHFIELALWSLFSWNKFQEVLAGEEGVFFG